MILLSVIGILERSLEKKAGRTYAPVGNRKMIYLIDDMNMPAVDAYGTVQPHTLIRQHLDYGHWWEELPNALHTLNFAGWKMLLNKCVLLNIVNIESLLGLFRYDSQKLTLKDITSTQYVACMNPTAGSFTINPRLQVHFSVISWCWNKSRMVCQSCGCEQWCSKLLQ